MLAPAQETNQPWQNVLLVAHDGTDAEEVDDGAGAELTLYWVPACQMDIVTNILV